MKDKYRQKLLSPKEKISSNVESSHHVNCEIFENLLRCSIVCILSAQLITKNLWTAAVKWQTAQSRVLHQIPLLVLSCDHWWPSFCDLSKQQLIRTYCSIFYIISIKWKEWHLKFKTVKNIAVLVLLIPISYTSTKQQAVIYCIIRKASWQMATEEPVSLESAGDINTTSLYLSLLSKVFGTS